MRYKGIVKSDANAQPKLRIYRERLVCLKAFLTAFISRVSNLNILLRPKIKKKLVIKYD